MKKHINILFLTVLTLFSSCTDDFVDIDERGVSTAETVSDLRDVLDGINAGLGQTPTGQISRLVDNFEDYFSDEVRSISAATYNGLTFEPERRAYNLEDIINNETDGDASWSNYFRVIASANFVLNRVDNLPEVTLNQKNQVKGEALTYRAFSYLWLVNIYAKNYTQATAATDLGLPIIEEFGNQNVSLERASVQEVYDLIISDLTEATALLADEVKHITLPSKVAAYGLLAKAYLQMGEYEKAQQNSRFALSIQNTLLDYNTLEATNILVDFVSPAVVSVRPPADLDPENIFFFNNQANFDFSTFGAFSVLPGQSVSFVLPSTTSFVTPELEALGNPFDIRFARMIIERPSGEKRFVGGEEVFKTTVRGQSKGVNVAELRLIDAECEARIGVFSTAMNMLNDFRLTRFLSSAPAGLHELAAANQNETIQHILDERQREFMYRGYRMFDIKRLNAHHNAGISVTHINPLDGSKATLESNDPKWAAPLPLSEIALAPELKQNPRN